MSIILGLDLGTNSIGCTLRNTSEKEDQIVFATSLTFEKGVGEEKGVEVPLVQQRTLSRGKRRNYNARRYRKWLLLETLINSSPPMCPLTLDELNKWRKYDSSSESEYPKSESFLQWLKLDFNGDNISDFINPYELRVMAVKEKFTNPLILGRVFYHMTQKRGFKGRDEAESETILKGSEEKGIQGAERTIDLMESDNISLSEALLIDHNINKKRIRNRYNLRNLVENEFNTICNVQCIDQSSELYKNLLKSIIWQRPLRSQKGNIGICTFEPKKQRCPISHPLFEEYRALAFINNIKITPIESQNSNYLSDEQKGLIYHRLFFRKSKVAFEFSEIIKVLDPKKNLYKFNFKEYTNVSGCPVKAQLEDFFGCNLNEIKITNSLNNTTGKGYYDYEDLWHVLYSFSDNESIIKFAKEKLGLSEERAVKFSKVRLPQGFASLSIYAIKKILKYLKKGYIYSDSVFLANLDKVVGKKLNEDKENEIITKIRNLQHKHKSLQQTNAIINNLINNHINNDEESEIKSGKYLSIERLNELVEIEIINVLGIEKWNRFDEQEKNHLIVEIRAHFEKFLANKYTHSLGLMFYKTPRFDDMLKGLLKKEFPDWEEERFKYLYHPAESEFYPAAKVVNGKKILGSPEPISKGFKNPMALKTLHVMKKLINHLILTEKIDSETRIVVEIARELNDANKRAAIARWQNDREKENKLFADKIIEMAEGLGYPDLEVDDNLILKYRLWHDQKGQCLYTGRVIDFAELIDGTTVDIEHTIPASISFDNELGNLTLADSRYNRDIKGNKIPAQLPNYENGIEINGISYPAILKTASFLEDKVKHFEKLIEEAKKRSKHAQTKEQKDAQIQKRHYFKMELDYWKKKKRTFFDKEIKNSWKNSQLVDTQIITKYALHYLKTVFNNVEVQKGSVTAAFRKIFNVGFKKDRDNSVHHAIDAAILTLIPSSRKRDVLLQRYFSALDLDRSFHIIPEGWANFSPTQILDLQKKVFVNFYKKNTTLLPTYKNVRKRGKIQYVKKQLENGKFEYLLDENGNKIPLIAQGDSIRGQLHEETFFGAIQLGKNSKGISEKYKTEKKPLLFVVRVPIQSFTKMEDLNKIIDDKVRNDIQKTINKKISIGKTFVDSINEDIWLLDKNEKEIKQDKNGNTLFPIRHVRCVSAVGRGILTSEKALQIKQHTFLSKQEYKQYYYAKNEEISVCLFYEKNDNSKVIRGTRLIGLFELSQIQIKHLNELFSIPEYAIYPKNNLPLKYIITTGCRVIIYENSPEELRELSKPELIKRVYRIYKFNNAGADYIYLQCHAEARQDKDLGVGDTTVDFSKYQPRLKLVPNNFNCLLENYDFEISIDGEITFK
ncbi:MAG: hypothetical protein M0P71_13865 [Melioribacteraceae bacterium]|nr:hypothetical protein [Melioribacteraceae bacterium]